MKIGIDIGGTTIGTGVVENGTVKAKTINPSFGRNASLDETVSYLENLIDVFLDKNVSGIGIGVPSVVDTERGIVYDAQNIPSWKKVNLKEILEDHYGIPVHVNNDANCFAAGAYSHRFKDVVNLDSVLVGVTLGTGLGTGIVCGGKLLNGNNAGAGELCCLPYQGGILEDYCGSKFFQRAGMTCSEAMALAIAGNEAAAGLFKEFGRHLGYLMNLILYAYDPACIVIGGGIANSYSFFSGPMLEYVYETFTYKSVLEKVEIIQQTDDNISIIGAACL